VQAGARADEGGARHGGQRQYFQRADRKQQKGMHLDKPGAVCYPRFVWRSVWQPALKLGQALLANDERSFACAGLSFILETGKFSCAHVGPECVTALTHTKGLSVIVQYDGSDEAKSHRRGMPGAQRHASSSSEMATEMDLENSYARTLHELESQVWADVLYLPP
jgi:hypothetical protein